MKEKLNIKLKTLNVGLNIILSNPPRSAFWPTFCALGTTEKESIDYFLMGSFLDGGAPYPFENLTKYDRLLVYGLLMVDIGRKKQFLKGMSAENQANSPTQIDLSNIEKRKAIFLAKSPLLTKIDQAKIFPIKLIPTLATGFQLPEIQIQDWLEIAGCMPESLFTVREWGERYQKGLIYNDNTYGLCFDLSGFILNEAQIKSLVKALENDNEFQALDLESTNLDEKGIEILCKGLNKFHISTLLFANINIKEESLNLLAETLKKNTSLESLILHDCCITNTGALTLLKGLKTSCIKKLNLSHNPITWDSNNITDLLAEALNENTALRTLNLSSCRITNIGALALFKAVKICRITQLDLESNRITFHVTVSNSEAFQKALENNALKRLNLSGNPIQPHYLKDIVRYSLKPNTTLIELKLYVGNNLIHAAREIQQEADALVSRNKTYLKPHKKINRCLGSVRKILSPNTHHSTSTNSSSTESENSLEETGKHLGKALDEALKLYYAIPRYLHAEKLLHQVYVAMGMVYAQRGNYTALIALYFHHFISHPDPAIDKQLADLLKKLEDKTYQSAKLTLENKRTLCFVLELSEKKSTFALDSLFTRALEASEIPKQKLLKKLFVTPFHIAIQNNPDCFKQDPISFLQIVNALSPFEINLIFANATNAEITEYFGYLKNAWQSEEEKTEFLYNFSTANWIRFLNQLDLETLSTFTLATLGKKSGELRDALAHCHWLIIKLKSPAPELLAFARKQKLFSIPYLSSLIAKDSEIQKQLIEYGAFMAKLGKKIQQVELEYQQVELKHHHEDDLETFQNRIATLESEKTAFLSTRPWLSLIHDELAFPADLIPILEKIGELQFNNNSALLEKAGCLPHPNIDTLIKDNWVTIDGHSHIKCGSLHLGTIRQLSQILNSDTSLSKLTFPIRSTTKLFFLAEGLKTNTTLQQLNLSHSILNEKSATILAKLLKNNKTICELNLSHSNLSNNAVEILADALKTNTVIKKLIFDNSELGNTGVTLLAKAFESNKNLAELSLAKNGIGSEGTKALATTLKANGRKLRSLDLSNNNLEVKDAEIFSEILSKDNLLAFKQKLKLERDAAFLNHFKQSNVFIKLRARNNKIVERGDEWWFGQDFTKNKNKFNAIRDIEEKFFDYAHFTRKPYYFTVNKNEPFFSHSHYALTHIIDDTTLQNIYNFIKDQENIICASTRSDYCLTWFPRGKVDSVPLFNEIIKLFQEYDSELEINYRENITPKDVKENDETTLRST